jgi:hypothetical protein
MKPVTGIGGVFFKALSYGRFAWIGWGTEPNRAMGASQGEVTRRFVGNFTLRREL